MYIHIIHNPMGNIEIHCRIVSAKNFHCLIGSQMTVKSLEQVVTKRACIALLGYGGRLGRIEKAVL